MRLVPKKRHNLEEGKKKKEAKRKQTRIKQRYRLGYDHNVHVEHEVCVCRDYEPASQIKKRAAATARTLRHTRTNRRMYTPTFI